jgi:hypothetical protein
MTDKRVEQAIKAVEVYELDKSDEARRELRDAKCGAGCAQIEAVANGRIEDAQVAFLARMDCENMLEAI